MFKHLSTQLGGAKHIQIVAPFLGLCGEPVGKWLLREMVPQDIEARNEVSFATPHGPLGRKALEQVRGLARPEQLTAGGQSSSRRA